MIRTSPASFRIGWRARTAVAAVAAPQIVRPADIQVLAALSEQVDAAAWHATWQTAVRERRRAQQGLQSRRELVYEGYEFWIQRIRLDAFGRFRQRNRSKKLTALRCHRGPRAPARLFFPGRYAAAYRFPAVAGKQAGYATFSVR